MDATTQYEAALEVFRLAARKFAEVTKAYRAREIHDEEFLAARADFNLAQLTLDVAEAAVLAEVA